MITLRLERYRLQHDTGVCEFWIESCRHIPGEDILEGGGRRRELGGCDEADCDASRWLEAVWWEAPSFCYAAFTFGFCHLALFFLLTNLEQSKNVPQHHLLLVIVSNTVD